MPPVRSPAGTTRHGFHPTLKVVTASGSARMALPQPGPVPSPQKPTVVLLGFTSLSVGSGTEQFLRSVVRNAPFDDFRVVVAQTDFAPSRRWSDRYVADSLESAELLTLRSSRGTLDPDRLLLLASRSLAMYVLTALAFPLLRSSAARRSRQRNTDALRAIESADLLYLIRNDDRDWLEVDPARTVVVGSTHCDDLSGGLLAFESLPARNLLRAVYARIQRRRKVRRGQIDAYHVTQAVYWNQRVKRTDLDRFIPLGVDSERFMPGPPRARDDRVRFLFVGGLEPSKGLDRLLEAWRHVTSTRGELHVVGHGSLQAVVERDARRDPRIHYHGILEPDALTKVYRSCDIFLFPSRFETFGLVVLEALSSGLYVVASSAVRGVFDDFRDLAALEYLEMTPAALARRIQELSEGPLPLDDDRRLALHRMVEMQYDWTRVANDLFSWIRRLLETRRASPARSSPRP